MRRENERKSRNRNSVEATCPDVAETTAKLNAEHKKETSLLQSGVDRLTALLGRPAFTLVLTVMILCWIAANMLATYKGLKAIDPPPFVWLQGVLTAGALYVATLILTTQRREEKLSSQRGQLLLEMVILNDQKSSKIIELLEEARIDNPGLTDRVDDEARDMSKPANHRSVMGAIKDE